MGKKWLVTKTKAEVEDDMRKIIEAFGTVSDYARRVEGGHGTPKFNFEFTYKDKTFSGYDVQSVTKLVRKLGYNLRMWHFVAGCEHTLRLYLELHQPPKRMTRADLIKVHDRVMKTWVGSGEVLHVWRDYDIGHLTSYYVILFQHSTHKSLDLARIWGPNPSAPSIDQRVAIYDDSVTFAHPHRGIGSEW